MKKMFQIFYAVDYWITTVIFRNKNDEPEFASMIAMSIDIFFSLLFFYILITFHYFHSRELIRDENKTFGYIAITLTLIIVFSLFKKEHRIEALNKFNNLKKEDKVKYIIFVLIYKILLIISIIYLANSIKNNVYWF